MTQEEVGEFLLALYQGSKQHPIQTFRQWVLTQLARYIPFEWACWRYGTLNEDACRIHGMVCFRAPGSRQAMFEAAGNLPQAGTVSNPGQVLTLSSANLRTAAKVPCRLSAHATRNRTATGEDDSALYTEVSLYRDKADDPFTRQQRKDAEVIGAHVTESWLIKLRLYLNDDRMPVAPLGQKALCDIRGIIWCGQPQFEELLREEWSAWQGGSLPEELGKIIRAADGIFEGKHLRCTATPGPTPDLVCLQIHKQPPLLSLPPRQRRIAIELAQGKTYNQIAHNLGISRSTVTNHANAIYAKLGISNKVQLALLCFGNSLHTAIT